MSALLELPPARRAGRRPAGRPAVEPLATPKPEIDLDVQRVVLDVQGRKFRGLDTRIDNSLLDGSVERTIEGASTLELTVHDPKRALLQSGMFAYAIDVRLDRLYWRLVKVGKTDDDLTLTFEDRQVAYLRQHTKPRKAARGKVTRAEFALSLVREEKRGGGIKFVCPELHKAQTIAGKKKAPYQFRRGGTGGERENTWTCLQRLADEVQWRCFMSEGSLYFISEDQLMKAAPKLVLSETTPGIVSVDFDIDNGKVRSEVTVTCRASRWIAAPGAVVQLNDLGPANGKWLVSTLRRGLFDANAEITLKRATHKLAEPAGEMPVSASSRAAGGSDVAAAAAASGGQLARAYAAMQAIHAKHYPYVWGGGHSRAGVADRGTGRDPGIGYDCSGSTVAVLAAAGMGFRIGGGTAASGALMGWGVAGQGQHLTIWTNPTHVFMVIDGHHFGTGNWGKGWGGAGFNPNMHPTGGFVARHWPGT